MGVRSTGSHPTTTKADGHLLEYSRNTFVEGGGALAAPSNPISASGGNSTNTYTDNGKQYKAHIFTGSGTFVVDRDAKNFPSDVEYLVIAGGGGGGGFYQGGGGGAGGIRTNLSGHPLATGNPSFPVTTTGGNGSGSYTVTVGNGGDGTSTAGAAGNSGGDSYFGPPSTPAGITAKGGGGAGGFNQSGVSGGSGGGSGDQPASATKIGGYGYNPSTPSPIVPNIPSPHPYGITQGNPGGSDPDSGTYAAPYVAGGGGGAGGAGQGVSNSGNGGLGVQVLIAGPASHPGVGAVGPNGQEQWYCGGGGGGGYAGVPGTSGDGGAGTATNAPTSGWSGGGPGGPNGTGAGGNGVSGSTNSGGGGGGAVSPGPPYSGNGGAGGSGIVIIRYEFQ